MIISTDKKSCDNTQHPFEIKYHRTLGIEEDFLNLIRSIYKNKQTKNPTVSNILKVKDCAFLLRLRTR